LSLCNNAHTHVGTTTTQDNLSTSALSKTSLSAARLAMRDYLDETDNLINASGDTLLVPPELEQTAWELVMSDKKIDSAENNANFWKGRYKVLVWDYLTDTNNWFLIDSRYAKLFLKWFDRIPVEFNKDKDFDTLTVGSFTGNCEKQTDETAGNPNVKPWAISMEAAYWSLN